MERRGELGFKIIRGECYVKVACLGAFDYKSSPGGMLGRKGKVSFVCVLRHFRSGGGT